MNLEEPQFVDRPAMTVAGLDKRYTFDRVPEIPKQWEQLEPHLGSIPGQVDRVTYGVSHDGDQGGFGYLAGVEVKDTANLPEGFVTREIPARHYAVFTHRGHVSGLHSTCGAIWQQWLPKSGCRPIAECASMIERYDDKFCPDSADSEVTIWIPIEKA